MSHLRTSSRKVAIKYVGPLVIYKIIQPHNYLLMTLDGKILRGLFKHERLKPAIIRISQGCRDRNIIKLLKTYCKENFKFHLCYIINKVLKHIYTSQCMCILLL